MVPLAKNSKSVVAGNTWALPLAAIILVAGSLLFWTCIGLLWLATRQPAQQPIVIWMPPSVNANTAEPVSPIQLKRIIAPEVR